MHLTNKKKKTDEIIFEFHAQQPHGNLSFVHMRRGNNAI